jgi:hypothetical protein
LKHTQTECDAKSGHCDVKNGGPDDRFLAAEIVGSERIAALTQSRGLLGGISRQEEGGNTNKKEEC